MRKTPRGWIQIGESRTRGVARIPLGLKPSRDSRATSQRDSPIWIQPLGVFRYRITKCVVRLPVLTYREIVLQEKSALDLAFQLLLHCIFVPNLVTFLMLGSSKLIPKTNNDQLLKNIWPRACPTRPHPFVHYWLLRCRRLLVSTSSKSFYKKSVRFWYLFLFI